MYNDVKRKSHEQGFITKKCIATHANYFLNLNSFMLQCLKHFNNSRKLF